MSELLSKDHTILERPFMEFRPFGVDLDGTKIQDASGVAVRAYVDFLQESVARAAGGEAGARAVEELARLLNERIQDPAYHVTPDFLRNVWHSYSYEFLAFLREFCRKISGEDRIGHQIGPRLVSPILQTLGRPFSVSQIYSMLPHFGAKLLKGAVIYKMGRVTDRSATLRVRYTDRIYQQLGPYRKACIEVTCHAMKSAFESVPKQVHGLPPATARDLSCIVNGDEWCEWEITWSPVERHWFTKIIKRLFAS